MKPLIQGLVSVVIPVYNAERFLRETVKSVIAQTYETWELWLVDDGSADSSRQIAEGFAAEHPSKIFVIEHPGRVNKGVCSTRNLGIGFARGEYVAVLDADDLWLPNKLQEQVALLRSHPDAQMLFGRSEYFDDGVAGSERVPSLASPGLYQPPDLLKLSYPFGQAGAPCPSSFLLRASAFEKAGRFEESFNRLQVYEDQVFLAKMYLSVSILVSDKVWDRYRCHADSCWNRALRDGSESTTRSAYLDWLQRHLEGENLLTDQWKDALRRARRTPSNSVFARAFRSAQRAVRKLLK